MTYYLIHIQNDGRGGPEEVKLTGPYPTMNDQVVAARTIRDEHLEEGDALLWLDIDSTGYPEVRPFDPQFYAGGAAFA